MNTELFEMLIIEINEVHRLSSLYAPQRLRVKKIGMGL